MPTAVNPRPGTQCSPNPFSSIRNVCELPSAVFIPSGYGMRAPLRSAKNEAKEEAIPRRIGRSTKGLSIPPLMASGGHGSLLTNLPCRTLLFVVFILLLGACAKSASTKTPRLTISKPCTGGAVARSVKHPGFAELYDQCAAKRRDVYSTARCLTVSANLPEGCGNCYGAYAACVNEYCLTLCESDATTPDCRDCSQDACAEAFSECSGLSRVFPGTR